MKKQQTYERTAREIETGKRSRVELTKILKQKRSMLDDLNDEDFHMVYGLIWTLTAKDGLYRSAKQMQEMKQEEVVDLRKQLKGVQQ